MGLHTLGLLYVLRVCFELQIIDVGYSLYPLFRSGTVLIVTKQRQWDSVESWNVEVVVKSR